MKYSPNNVTLETLQEEAKSKKIGLWSKENPIAPWDFRKGNVSSTGNNENYKTDTTQPKGLVYITQTGRKYHNKGCRYLSKSQIPILLKDALQQRYEPCSVCNPPSKVEEIAPVYIPSTAGRAPPLPVDSQKTTESYSPPSFNNGSSYNSIPPTTNVQVQQQVADIQVFITNTGKKYHKDGCRYLSKSKIPINKNAAISRGYGACSVCRP